LAGRKSGQLPYADHKVDASPLTTLAAKIVK
jgi:hypothetical protein